MEKSGEKNPETNERGKEKNYHILVTERIYTSIRSAGMREYHEAIQSDHRTLFIDIDFEKLTGGETHELREPEEWVVKLKTRKYKENAVKR
jgi:hypothetical protein